MALNKPQPAEATRRRYDEDHQIVWRLKDLSIVYAFIVRRTFICCFLLYKNICIFGLKDKKEVMLYNALEL